MVYDPWGTDQDAILCIRHLRQGFWYLECSSLLGALVLIFFWRLVTHRPWFVPVLAGLYRLHPVAPMLIQWWAVTILVLFRHLVKQFVRLSRVVWVDPMGGPGMQWPVVALALASFPALGACFGIATRNVLRHARAVYARRSAGADAPCWKYRILRSGQNPVIREWKGVLPFGSDAAVRIALLPIVYGLLCSNSLLTVLALETDSPTRIDLLPVSEKDKEMLQMSMYESNFSVADMYEAWALMDFGRVALRAVQLHMGTGSAVALDVTKACRHLLLGSVQGFVVVCLASSVYSIACIWSELWIAHGHPEPLPQFPKWRLLKPYLTGATSVCSVVAVYNIVLFERCLRKYFPPDFHPAPKFWGVKVLVALAFWQTLLLKVVLSSWTRQDQLVVLASLKVFEVLAIAMANSWAWDPAQKWLAEIQKPNFGRQLVPGTVVPARDAMTLGIWLRWSDRQQPSAVIRSHVGRDSCWTCPLLAASTDGHVSLGHQSV